MQKMKSESANIVIISDNKILLQALRDNSAYILHAAGAEGASGLINDLKIVDCLIVDQEIEVGNLPTYRVKNLINCTSAEIDSNLFNSVRNFTRPIKLNELLKEIGSKLSNENIFCLLNKNWVYDELHDEIVSAKQKIPFTERENALFKAFIEAPDNVLTKEFLQQNLWNHHKNTESSTIETHLYKLKQKLPDDWLVMEGAEYRLMINDG